MAEARPPRIDARLQRTHAPGDDAARATASAHWLRRAAMEIPLWGVVAVAAANELLRDWRHGDPPLPTPDDFFPLATWSVWVIGALGVVGLALGTLTPRSRRFPGLSPMHRWIVAGLGLLALGVLVASLLPLPGELPPAYQRFSPERVVLLGLGLTGVVVAAARMRGRSLRARLFWLTIGITWLSVLVTAGKWLRNDPVTLVAIPDTPSIFPVTGVFWNPNLLALVLVPSLVIQLATLRSRGDLRDRVGLGPGHRREAVLWLVGPVATSMLLVASLSRTGIVAGAIAILVMLVPGPFSAQRSSASSGVRSAGAVAGLAALVAALVLAPLVIAFAGGPGFNDRDLIWRRAWEAIAARPLTGWGADSGGHQHAHNQLLESWQTGGAIGVAGLLIVVAVAVIAAVTHVRADSRLALGIVVVTAVQAGAEVFTPWQKFPVLPVGLVLVVLAVVASVSLGRDLEERDEARPRSERRRGPIPDGAPSQSTEPQPRGGLAPDGAPSQSTEPQPRGGLALDGAPHPGDTSHGADLDHSIGSDVSTAHEPRSNAT